MISAGKRWRLYESVRCDVFIRQVWRAGPELCKGEVNLTMPAACMRGAMPVRKSPLSEEFGPAGLGDMVSPGVERPGQFRFAMFQGSGNIPPILAIVRRLVARGQHVRGIAGPGLAPGHPRSATQCRLPGGYSGGRGDAHPAAAGSRPLRGGVRSPWLAVGVDAAVVRGQCLCRAPFPGGTRLAQSRQRGAPPSAGRCGGRRLLPLRHARGGGAIMWYRT
jgi:hypothetical protein